jgi:hypothetical protein
MHEKRVESQPSTLKLHCSTSSRQEWLKTSELIFSLTFDLSVPRGYYCASAKLTSTSTVEESEAGTNFHR